MKILHVLKSNQYSGAEHVVCSIIKNMPQGYDCIYMTVNGPIIERLKKEGITYYCVEKLDLKVIQKAIEEISPNIIHAHDFTASVLCSMFNKQDIKIYSHIHCNPTWIKRINIKSIAFLFACQRVEYVFTVSDIIKKEFFCAQAIENKMVSLGNPFSRKEVLEKSRLEEKDDIKYDLMYVGRLEEEKNPLQFIEIVNRVKCIKPGVCGIMIGQGSLADECHKKIAAYDLKENIKMLGFLENPYGAMKKAKIICIPSKWEGFGLVAVEAMTLGIPVVCSGAGGLSDIVNEKNGYCCKDIESYCSEIVQLLSNAQYYKNKSQEAKNTSILFDNVDNYIKKLLFYYNR